MRPGNKESNAPFISFVLEIKTKLPKKASVAIDNTNTVVLSKIKLPSVRLATRVIISVLISTETHDTKHLLPPSDLNGSNWKFFPPTRD